MNKPKLPDHLRPPFHVVPDIKGRFARDQISDKNGQYFSGELVNETAEIICYALNSTYSRKKKTQEEFGKWRRRKLRAAE